MAKHNKNRCPNAQFLDENHDIPYCSKFENFCYLDEPNMKVCDNLYGDPDISLCEVEEEIEDSELIEDEEYSDDEVNEDE